MSGVHDPAEIDRQVARSARVWAHYVGEPAGFAADRAAAASAAMLFPGGMDTARVAARSSRAFALRAVRWLAAEVGVRQFLDIGSGIPTGTNIHNVAQATAGGSRVVYVDSDPVVLAHAHQVLRDADPGKVAFVHADLRNPISIIEHAAGTLDLDEPVAVLLIAVLHLLPDADADTDPCRIVSRLMDALATGSHLVVSHLACDIHPVEMARVEQSLNATTAETWRLRDRDRVRGFFDGLDLVDGGVVQVDRWRPHDPPGPVRPPEGCRTPMWVGVGRKP